MTRPRAYPESDSREIDGITILRRLVDSERVKLHIQERDKVPNIDGYVELLDDHRRPAAKLDVQVKTIPGGTEKYPCPTSLFAYADEVTTLPVILICVDIAREVAFWRHIRPDDRPTDSRQTVTIRFSSTERIEEDCGYIAQWLSIAQERRVDQREMKRLREVRDSVRNPVRTLSTGAVRSLQQFVDRLNMRLDGQFRGLKRLLYPNTWKLSVGCGRFSDSVAYALFPIDQGESWPLVWEIDDLRALLDSADQVHPRPVQVRTSSTNRLEADPEAEADTLLWEWWMDCVDARRLRAGSRPLQHEAVLGFVRRYADTLGLSTGDSYRTEDVVNAIHGYLPRWITAAVQLYGWPDRSSGLDQLRLLQMRAAGRTDLDVQLEPLPDALAFALTSDPPLRVVVDGLARIREEGDPIIAQPAYSRVQPNDVRALREAGLDVMKLFRPALSEFLGANFLSMEDFDPFADAARVAIVTTASASAEGQFGWRICRLGTAPPGGMTTIDFFTEDDAPRALLDVDFGQEIVEYDGSTYEVIGLEWMAPTVALYDSPLTKLVYQRVEHGLNDLLGRGSLSSRMRWWRGTAWPRQRF